MAHRGRLRVVSLVVGVCLIATAPGASESCLAAAVSDFIPPVDGAVVRRFEAPLGPYAAGHRGIDYGVPEGTPVAASAEGVVKFAGPVADDGLFVTIKHDELIETTYSFLSQISVQAGMKVKQGDVIAASGPGHPAEGVPVLHFGAKVAGQYIDPEILLFGNLDDISHLISLAPFDDQGSIDETSGSVARGGALEPREAPNGLLPTIGSGVLGVVRKVRDAPAKGWNWVTSNVRGVIDFSKGVWRGIGQSLGAAWDRTARFAEDVGKTTSTVVGKFGDFLSSVAKSVGGFVVAGWRLSLKALKAAMGVLGKVLRALGNSLKTAGRTIKRLSKSAANRIFVLRHLAVFAYGMVKGSMEQIVCQAEGGATPPEIPSKEEFAAGAKAPPAPNDNIVIAVAGIGSSTEELSDGTVVPHAGIYKFDFRTLGYSEDNIYHFSYKGIEEREGGGVYRLHAPYTKEDTYRSIVDSADMLAEQVEAIQKSHPGKQVDLVAHSQGGLVARYFIQELLKQGHVEHPDIAHFISLGTPHGGADAARIYDAFHDSFQGRVALAELGLVANVTGLPPPSAPAAREMSESSTFIANLQEGWDPSKVPTTSIAAAFDGVVPSLRTRLEGANNFTVNLPVLSIWQHSDLVTAANTKGLVYNALSDKDSECTALRNAVADYGSGRLISELESSLLDATDLAGELVAPYGYNP